MVFTRRHRSLPTRAAANASRPASTKLNPVVGKSPGTCSRYHSRSQYRPTPPRISSTKPSDWMKLAETLLASLATSDFSSSGIRPTPLFTASRNDGHEGRAARHDVAFASTDTRERIGQCARRSHAHQSNVVVRQGRDELDAEPLGLRQKRPGGLAVHLVRLAQTRLKLARVRRVEPLEEVRAAQSVRALCDEDYVAALIARVGRHLKCLVRLNQVDVVRQAPGGDDDDRASLSDFYRVRVGVLRTGAPMCRAPFARVEAHDPTLVINDRVD